MRGIYGQILDPIGPLGRVDGTANAGVQAHDHDVFQAALDGLAQEVLDIEANGLGGAVLDTLNRQYGGITVWPRALDRVRFFPDTAQVYDVAMFGDSTVEEVHVVDTDTVAARLGRALGRELGPSLGPGFRGPWHSAQDPNVVNFGHVNEWFEGREVYDAQTTIGVNTITAPSAQWAPNDTVRPSVITAPGLFVPGTVILSFSGATATVSNPALATTSAGTVQIGSSVDWTHTLTTDAFNVAPYAEGRYQSFVSTAVAGRQLSYRVPANVWAPIVAADILYIDFPGSANWTYRRDNSLGWTSSGAALLGDNKLKRIRIGAISKTLAIRAASISGAGANVGIAGIILYTKDPATNQGMVVHNIGRDGAKLGDLVQLGAAGDPLAILSGHPGSLNPIFATSQFSNDALDNNTTTWQARLQAFVDRTYPLCDLALVNIFEQGGPRLTGPGGDGTTMTAAIQKAYRDMVRTVAVANAAAQPISVLDLYDMYAAIGYTGYAAVNAGGFMYDAAHSNLKGVQTQAAAHHRLLSLS